MITFADETETQEADYIKKIFSDQHMDEYNREFENIENLEPIIFPDLPEKEKQLSLFDMEG